MSITKRADGKWVLNIKPGGRTGHQTKRIFQTQGEAKQYEIWAKSNQQNDPDWLPAKRDSRRLSELVDAWYDQHGIGLSNGKKTLLTLKKACEELGNPVASNFTIDDFASYRTNRIDKGITANTVNRVHAYLRAVFNHLIKSNQWQKDNPLNKLKQFKIQESEGKKYLTFEEIERLLITLKNSRNPHAYLISKVCLATGGRWDEVVQLRTTQIQNETLQFANVTKSKKARAVRIDSALRAEILAHMKAHALPDKRIFEEARDAFANAVKAADIELHERQMTHVLRHTFASHFVIEGRNLLTLQKILGHKDYQTTLKYAHLAPDHLEETASFNPLALMKKKNAVGSPLEV
jgi:site-specific recombinase XerD